MNVTNSLKKSAALALLSLLMAGCAVGPRYKSPQPPEITYHAADPALVSATAYNAQWWKQFEDPVLDSLVDRTLTANNSIKIARARLAESRAIYDERRLDRYPTAPVEASYNYSKEQIPGFSDDRRTINTFKTGFDAFWELDRFGRLGHGIAAGRAETDAFAADLLGRRPDVRAAERRLASATELQGVAVAGLFPKVSVSGFLGFLAGRSNLFLMPESAAWSASPGLSWSAFDLGRARARVRGSKASADEAMASYEDTVLRALEETENALANYRAQQALLVKLNEQARESKRAADIARLRYREGVIDFLSLLDAERTQLQAEDAVAQAESEVYVGVITLYKALGG